jgi:hypothetical protein
MDASIRLEHALRYLKNVEPTILHWEEMGDVHRCTEVDGVVLNCGALNKDVRHMMDGLVLAVHLLAKKSAELQRRLDGLENHGTNGSTGQHEKQQ